MFEYTFKHRYSAVLKSIISVLIMKKSKKTKNPATFTTIGHIYIMFINFFAVLVDKVTSCHLVVILLTIVAMVAVGDSSLSPIK
jgi:hypothetical protein